MAIMDRRMIHVLGGMEQGGERFHYATQACNLKLMNYFSYHGELKPQKE